MDVPSLYIRQKGRSTQHNSRCSLTVSVKIALMLPFLLIPIVFFCLGTIPNPLRLILADYLRNLTSRRNRDNITLNLLIQNASVIAAFDPYVGKWIIEKTTWSGSPPPRAFCWKIAASSLRAIANVIAFAVVDTDLTMTIGEMADVMWSIQARPQRSAAEIGYVANATWTPCQ